LLTAYPNRNRKPRDHPALPLSPEKLVEDTREVVRAGAPMRRQHAASGGQRVVAAMGNLGYIKERIR
jgi:uncharacterized protein (DUF849 family)